jgi:glycosyltransferase involved in cell wall biosynthesis
MKRVLHITNWYPNRWDNLEGSFVKEQYKLFSQVTDSYLINVQVRQGHRYFAYEHIHYSEHEEGYYLLTKIQSTKVRELLTTLLLLVVLFRSDYRKYHLIHMHIAYPLLIHYYLWKKVIKTPIVISEHWSAYHFNFYLPWGSKKLKSIQRIFQQSIPLITVSKSLGEDIQRFSSSSTFPLYIIPNVIHKHFFDLKERHQNAIPTFLMINYWTDIKNPFPVLRAFSQLTAPYLLQIGGYGDLYPQLKRFVQKYHMQERVIFLGKMSSLEVQESLSRSDIYLYSSQYETFSMICVEALLCGVPVMGPKIEAILEYTDRSNAIYIEKNEEQCWLEQLYQYIEKRPYFDSLSIAYCTQQRFSYASIKESYLAYIN